jgi:hypothetical protein
LCLCRSGCRATGTGNVSSFYQLYKNQGTQFSSDGIHWE